MSFEWILLKTNNIFCNYSHSDTKVASSHEELDEKFVNYFLKTKAKNMIYKESLHVHVYGYKKV